MSLHPSAWRHARIAATSAIAGAAMLAAFPVQAQSIVATNRSPAPASKVDAGNCAAFFHYIVNEYKLFPTEHSKTFLASALRFNRAGCATFDRDGEIQLITENNRDAVTFDLALSLMGKYDILGTSGVAHCARPPNGVCPTRTTANLPKTGS